MFYICNNNKFFKYWSLAARSWTYSINIIKRQDLLLSSVATPKISIRLVRFPRRRQNWKICFVARRRATKGSIARIFVFARRERRNGRRGKSVFTLWESSEYTFAYLRAWLAHERENFCRERSRSAVFNSWEIQRRLHNENCNNYDLGTSKKIGKSHYHQSFLN